MRRLFPGPLQRILIILPGRDAVARCVWSVLALLTAVSGCFTTDSARPGGLNKRWHQTGLQDNAVQLDVAFVMRPVGDHYINRELWTHTDEMVVELDRRAPLEENG